MAYNTMPCARAARIIGLLFGADMDIWRVGGLVRIQGGACRDSPPLVLGLLRDRARISEAGARGGRTGPGSGTVGGKRPFAIVGGKHRQFLPPFISYIAPPCLGWMGAC